METPSVTFTPRTIAIVGAGFSGAMLAANLLRRPSGMPLRVVLIEQAPRMARGAAYAERSHAYLLNVPASRMSANSQKPLEFLEFARAHRPDATADDFLPRALYGDYLEAVLRDAELNAPSQVRLDRIHGEVASVEQLGDTRINGSPRADSGFHIKLSNGLHLVADDVVLATGNPPPASLPGAEGVKDSPAYVEDPWRAEDAFRPGETVLVLGTGLTMADTILAGERATRGQITIHALSRRGLVPPSQTAFKHGDCKGDSNALLRAASFSARRLMSEVRKLAEDTDARGADWREAITFVRNLAPVLWQRLPLRERRRFLRHARPYWDIHRHRLPPNTLACLQKMQLKQQLHIHAGRILEMTLLSGDRIRVTWRPRGAPTSTSLVVDRVVNCTGPDYDLRRSQDPLIRSLLAQGLITPDPLGLGLRTGDHNSVIDARGRVVRNLFYVGPMLRAEHWEATAATELRGHVERLAQHLTTSEIQPVRQPPSQALQQIALL